MNAETLNATQTNVAPSVEFFRLPQPGKRDPFFGLSRSWYYKAAALGVIKLVAVKLRGADRGVRLVSYASVRDYITRDTPKPTPDLDVNRSATGAKAIEPLSDREGQFALFGDLPREAGAGRRP